MNESGKQMLWELVTTFGPKDVALSLAGATDEVAELVDRDDSPLIHAAAESYRELAIDIRLAVEKVVQWKLPK